MYRSLWEQVYRHVTPPPRADTWAGVAEGWLFIPRRGAGRGDVSARAGFCAGGTHEGCVKFRAREFGMGGEGYMYPGVLYAP